MFYLSPSLAAFLFLPLPKILAATTEDPPLTCSGILSRSFALKTCAKPPASRKSVASNCSRENILSLGIECLSSAMIYANSGPILKNKLIVHGFCFTGVRIHA